MFQSYLDPVHQVLSTAGVTPTVIEKACSVYINGVLLGWGEDTCVRTHLTLGGIHNPVY